MKTPSLPWHNFPSMFDKHLFTKFCRMAYFQLRMVWLILFQTFTEWTESTSFGIRSISSVCRNLKFASGNTGLWMWIIRDSLKLKWIDNLHVLTYLFIPMNLIFLSSWFTKLRRITRCTKKKVSEIFVLKGDV